MHPYQMPMSQFVPGMNQHCITQAEVDYRNDMEVFGKSMLRGREWRSSV